MKMKPETYAALKAAVLPIMEAKAICSGGETNERWRWDCLWRSGFRFDYRSEDLTDNHIDTALRAIVREAQTKESAQ